jgi:hypothetical protein
MRYIGDRWEKHLFKWICSFSDKWISGSIDIVKYSLEIVVKLSSSLSIHLKINQTKIKQLRVVNVVFF